MLQKDIFTETIAEESFDKFFTKMYNFCFKSSPFCAQGGKTALQERYYLPRCTQSIGIHDYAN